MKLIVGLGNPGKEYENTRHNIGFMVLDNYARVNNFEITKKKFNGLYEKAKIDSQDVIFLKPLSYMNLSGEVVKAFVDYFKINIDDILIINDDLDLEVGKFRLKPSGSSGGHNGLKNIALHLQTENYKRFKIGISNNKNIDTKDYVLGRFSVDEIKVLEGVYEKLVDVVDDFCDIGLDKLMTKYNNK